MKIKYFTGIIIFSILLSGCAMFKVQQQQTPKVMVFDKQALYLPTPEQLGLNLTAVQIVSADYKIKDVDKHYSSEVHVQATPQKLTLVAAAGWGGELFSLQYDGKIIHSSSLPMPNANMGIDHTLTDFIFTYAPQSALNDILAKTNMSLQVTQLQRSFYQNGKKVIQIDYQNVNPWQGTVVLHNIELNYTVTVQTLSVTKS